MIADDEVRRLTGGLHPDTSPEQVLAAEEMFRATYDALARPREEAAAERAAYVMGHFAHDDDCALIDDPDAHCTCGTEDEG